MTFEGKLTFLFLDSVSTEISTEVTSRVATYCLPCVFEHMKGRRVFVSPRTRFTLPCRGMDLDFLFYMVRIKVPLKQALLPLAALKGFHTDHRLWRTSSVFDCYAVELVC